MNDTQYEIEKELDRDGAAVITWMFLAILVCGVVAIIYSFV